MQTLAQTLTAGNVSGGTDIQMSGANLDLNDGSGSGGGDLRMDDGNLLGVNSLQGHLGGEIVFASGVLQLYNAAVSLNGGTNNLNMNDGSGSGGAKLNLDGAQLEWGSNAGGAPSNPATPAGWLFATLNGSSIWLPYYQ